jgi:aspartate/methionine/tyrosine aminotransferase
LVFSRRSQHDFRPNRLALALAAARTRGVALLDLTVSNPTTAGIPYAPGITDALIRSPDVLRYEPLAFGLASARAAVSALWRERGLCVPEERILLTASTSEAYAVSFKLLCDPGDEVLVPAPSYPLFEHLAGLENVRVVPYRLGYDGAWFLDVNEVAARRSERARAVVVVSPNNPTGSYLKRDELARLAALGLPILSDEVFGEYPLGGEAGRASSVLESAETLVIALDGLSKLAALPQLKLAWMSLNGPDRLVSEALSRLELILDTFLSPNTPVQHALPALLDSRHVAQAAILDRARANQKSLQTACEGTPVSVLPAEGGWYAVLRLPDVMSDEEWALALLEGGVLVQPGYFFDFDAAPHVVVSLLTPEATLREGAARLLGRVSAAT